MDKETFHMLSRENAHSCIITFVSISVSAIIMLSALHQPERIDIGFLSIRVPIFISVSIFFLSKILFMVNNFMKKDFNLKKALVSIISFLMFSIIGTIEYADYIKDNFDISTLLKAYWILAFVLVVVFMVAYITFKVEKWRKDGK